jgi:ABC-type amino acid transport substrate-binding protein
MMLCATAVAQDPGTRAAPAASNPAATEGYVGDFPNRELVVGTKVAPPFAMKESDGNWAGISIDLWRQIAEKLDLKFRLVEETSVQSLIEGTAHGNYDLSVAAITITADRERNIDFSQPFYDTGLGIAVSVRNGSVWQEIIRTLTSLGFLQAAGALIGIALLVGTLIWVFERRHNEDFGGGAVKGSEPASGGPQRR